MIRRPPRSTRTDTLFPTRRSSDLIVLQAAGRIVALFMANHHDAALTQPSEAAEDCLIVAESAITRERDEFVENTSDIMFEVRPLGMAGDLRLLPGRKLGIGVGQHLVRPGLKPLNFRVYIERALIGGLTQFRDAGLKRRYRLFEIEKTYHGPGVKAVRASGQRADDAH